MHAYTAEVSSKPMVIRDELLVKVRCVDFGDLEAVRPGLAECVERAEAKPARFERLQERLLAGCTEEEYLATAERVGPYPTPLGRLALERANLRWGEDRPADPRPACRSTRRALEGDCTVALSHASGRTSEAPVVLRRWIPTAMTSVIPAPARLSWTDHAPQAQRRGVVSFKTPASAARRAGQRRTYAQPAMFTPRRGPAVRAPSPAADAARPPVGPVR